MSYTQTENSKVILLTGPSGVGKTTVAYEMVAILKEHKIGHGMIDTDELDRLFPEPNDSDDLFIDNLKLVWTSFAERGCKRLILCAVLKGAVEVPQDIADSVGENAAIQMFRLQAPEHVLCERISKREVGSLLEQHIDSSMRALSLNGETDHEVDVIVNDRDVRTVALQVLNAAGWL